MSFQLSYLSYLRSMTFTKNVNNNEVWNLKRKVKIVKNRLNLRIRNPDSRFTNEKSGKLTLLSSWSWIIFWQGLNFEILTSKFEICDGQILSEENFFYNFYICIRSMKILWGKKNKKVHVRLTFVSSACKALKSSCHLTNFLKSGVNFKKK